MTTRKLEKVITNICRVQVISEPSIYMKVHFLFYNILQQSPLIRAPQYLSSLADIQPAGDRRRYLVHESAVGRDKDCL